MIFFNMAISVKLKQLLSLALAVTYVLSLCKHGRADDYSSETGAAGVLANGYLPRSGDEDEEPHESGGADNDPAHILSKALLCFNDKYIYSSCEESCRLTVSGNLNVPPDYTDEYCSGPCLKETHLVLSCIEGILSHFQFYNKATIFDIRETIKAGCSHGPKRGDFNVLKHLQSEEGSARTATFTFVYGLVLMIMVCCLLI